MGAPDTTPLLPCPFCGAEITIHGGFICHPNDDCVIGGTEIADDPEFVAAWNTRASHVDPLRRALERVRTMLFDEHAPMLLIGEAINTALGHDQARGETQS